MSKLKEILQVELEPIRKRRKEFEEDIPGLYEILRSGSYNARIIAKNTLEEVECNLSFDSTKVITSLTYNEELDLFAVTYSGDNGIYFYNNNQELQYSVDGSLINANGLNFQTLNSDNNYIYASFSTDRTFAISINVLDWKGNVIGNKYINTNANDYTGVKLGLGEQSVAQTIVDINGKSYILVLQWGVSSEGANDTGAYLYPVKL